LMTYDREAGGAFKRVTSSEPNKFDIGWCRWANEKRVLCGLYGNQRGSKYAQPPVKRMFAGKSDGSHPKALDPSRDEANPLAVKTNASNFNMNYGQGTSLSSSSSSALGTGSAADHWSFDVFNPARQDEILDLTPDEDDTVLIEFDDDHDNYRSIY